MFAVTPTGIPLLGKVKHSHLTLSDMHTCKRLKTFLLTGILGSAVMLPPAHAAPDIAEPEPADPAVLPVMVPGKMETADSAFAKLDTGKKGYLTAEDTEVLEGFGEAFEASDADQNEKLTPDEFIHSWEAYTGIPSSPETFQRVK